MTATRKGDTCELLSFLQLLSFKSRALREIGIRQCYSGKRKRNMRKHYCENDLAKADLYTWNRRQNVGFWKFPLSHNIASS